MIIWLISIWYNQIYVILRPGVLAIGLIGSTLALSGLVAYAIVQVNIITFRYKCFLALIKSVEDNVSISMTAHLHVRTLYHYSVLFSGILNFIFRCQHCALTLATTSPTRQLRRQKRRVSGRLTKHKALTVNCGRSVKVYYVFNVLQEHRLHQRDCWCRLRGCPWTLGKPPSGWFFYDFL